MLKKVDRETKRRIVYPFFVFRKSSEEFLFRRQKKVRFFIFSEKTENFLELFHFREKSIPVEAAQDDDGVDVAAVVGTIAAVQRRR